ncbi:phosphofurin acidic cluster sorting protein 2 isoform X1 [Drosophila elegans]|uniref:phosphofurin acidic cluster sorting protein 2 isoform X1 n=2 Tax=Drosophila elegans TaxID=30023 RepID=UPI0007E6AADD|nr:phosphofurin acidic cluster sorting protein 2 isoform X1 [Drosophila elegans]XP_017113554.1 phosphofurin acidic cluster sorting protein 2 isoform X1 [Drosophila elegans]
MKMVDKSSKLVDKFAVISGTGGSGTGGGPINMPVGMSSTAGLGGGLGGGGGMTSGGANGQKPVPMKLFAAWEVDRTPPNCIPRLCSLTITRLSILTPLPGDTTSLSLAVKMQSSKRTLRSHEIPINGSALTSSAPLQGNSPMSVVGGAGGTPGSAGTAGGLGVAVPLTETELDLHFSLQYPHFIKRDGNSRLVILLQRRKKYKSRTILGYKTLAEGIIRMDAVLQKSMDMIIELTASGKNGRPGTVVACLRAERVSSIPVDHDNKNNNSVLLADRVAEYSDEDEEVEFSSGEFNDEANELGLIRGYEPKDPRDYNHPAKHDMRKYRNKLQRSGIEDCALVGHHPGSIQHHHPGVVVDSDSEFEMKDKSSSRAKFSRTISLQQRNLKQKIVALLKRFKVSEELEGESGHRGTAALRGERDLDALFQELESLSCCEGDDSGPDMDSISVGSTPKPSLRPFFTNSRIMLHDNITGNGADLNQLLGGGSGPGIAAAGNSERRSSDKSDQLTNSSYNLENNKNQKSIHLTNNNNSATTPDRGGNDSSGNEGNAGYTDGQNSDPQNSPPRDKDYMRLQQMQQQQQQQLTPVSSVAASLGSGSVPTPAQTEKRSRLFRTSSNTPGITGSAGNSANAISASGGGKRKHTLSLSSEPRSMLETCLSPTNVEPRKLLLDQLSRVFAGEDSAIPEVVTIISPPEALGGSALLAKLVTLFANSFKPAFVPQNTAEVKAVLQALMAKIQKYCNSNAKPPHTVKVLLIGGDWLQGATLRHYVELMGVRPPDWLNHLRFYLVPVGGSCGSVARHLSQMDQAYAVMFGSDNWAQLCERAAATAAAVSAVTTVNATALTTNLADAAGVAKSDIAELVQRIQRYLLAAGPCTQIPIAEAMVNYKDEDSCQIFVPFVSDVRIGYLDAQASLDLEEITAGSNAAATGLGSGSASSSAIPIGSQSSPNVHGVVSGSPPQQQSLGRISPPLQTPPSSATSHRERNTSESLSTPSSLQQQTFSGALAAAEAVELQVDYWPLVRPGEVHAKESKSGMSKGSDAGGKNSIKSTFRNLQVWRLPQHAQQLGDMFNGLTVSFATKEKKQKQIMRLGKKKDKERDLEKEQCVEGVARLICSPKQSHPVPLRVYIDGTEWTGVKFFQVSSQWQTHVKNFPIALIGCTPMSCAELS